MLQIKNFVELQPYDEVTTFAGAEAERVVKSYVVTGEGGTLAAQIIEELVAPRGAAPALQVISGKRGVGKSHLLSFLRSVFGVKALRTAHHDARLTSALRQLADRTPVAFDLNFASSEPAAFDRVLRTVIGEVLAVADDFNDERWARAVSSEQVFEQVCGMLPLDAQLVLFIDNLSGRWRGSPETVEADLHWLTTIARQAEWLPLRAIIALDEESLTPDHFKSRISNLKSDSLATVIARHARIHYISPESLHEIVAHHLLRKTPKQMGELGALYRQLRERLPHFAWLEDEFVSYYPVHPALDRLAPMIRAHSRSFSLPGFIASAAARALNRPALSLVVMDEVFDRYEYELRKDESLNAAFALYDRLGGEGANSLPVDDRLWAKMLAKSLFLFSLSPHPVSVQTLADSQLLFEEGDAEAGYQRVARILTHCERVCPAALYAEGEGLDRRYLLASAYQVIPLEDQLTAAAREIETADPRLAELLVTIGGQVFSDWCLGSDRGGGPRIPAIPYEVVWRGTVRRGELRFGGVEDVEVGMVAGMRLVRDAEDDLLGLDEVSVGAREDEDEGDWRLVVVPFNCDLDLEAPSVSTLALRWRAGLLNYEAELQPLKMMAALAACRENYQDRSDEVERVEGELRGRVIELFTELYLRRGSLIDHRGPQPIPPEYCHTAAFTDFLAEAVGATLSNCFPDHPRFKGTLTEAEVAKLVVGLFANSDDDEATREAASNFAEPLGLVAELEGSYRLNIFSDTALSQPFVRRLFVLIEKHTESSGLASVPLADVRRTLNAPPYGLQPAAQDLILGALVAGGLIELVDESADERLDGANLHLGFEPGRYPALRRVAPMDYPIEVLTAWANHFAERRDLPAPARADARRRVRDALGRWLASWLEQDLVARFEQVPIEVLTMSAWQVVSVSLRRYSRAAAIVEAIRRETVALEAGLSRIMDVFNLDLVALDHARADVQSLEGFLSWMPAFIGLRNYLLAAEATGEAQIERARQRLLACLCETHKLLDAEPRQVLAAQFDDWRKRYIDFYVAAHETSVGPSAYRDLVASFLASAEWGKFKLLVKLKLDGRNFERDAEALNELVAETRCDLPVIEILQRQPHCCCSFRLNRRLHLGSLLDALKAVTGAALTYYGHLLWRRREELREQLSRRSQGPAGRAANDFLSACGDGHLEGLTPEVVSTLNECLPEPTLSALFPTLPDFGDGHYTKDELRERLTQWLESLPEQDGLRFRVERA